MISFVTISYAIGLISYLVYEYLIKNLHVLALFKNHKEISSAVLGACFTLLGFIAALIALLFGITDKDKFKAYKRAGYLKVLLWIYYLSIFSMLLTVFLGFISFSENKETAFSFILMLISFIANVFQVILITFGITNIVLSQEDSDG